MSPGDTTRTACVTGGNGYIASALVKMLLEKGYAVKTTVRNPGSILISLQFSVPWPIRSLFLHIERIMSARELYWYKPLAQWSYTGAIMITKNRQR